MSAGPRDPGREGPGEGRGINWRLIAIVIGAVIAFMVVKRLLPDLNLQDALDEVASRLGEWTYLLVGGLAFGETGAFIGLVLPGEFAVILGGAVAGQGVISLPLILGIAWLAAFLGDTAGFTVGHRVGRGFLMRHGPRVGITEERFHRVERYFAKHGGKTIVIGRFISLVRPLAPFIAAGSGMRYRDFVPYSVLGTGLWAATFVLLGYFGSRSLDQVEKLASRGSLVLGALIAIAVGIWLAVRFLRRPENRRRLVEGMEERRGLRPLLALGHRLRRPARFALHRLTPGHGVGLELTTLLAVLAVSLFVLVSYWAIIAADPSPTAGDMTAADIAREIRAGWLTSLAKGITELGSASVILPVALLAATVLAARSHWTEFWVLVVGLGTIFVLNGDIKELVDRPRPGGGLVGTNGDAFPSGHAAHSVLYVWLGATLSLRIRRGLPAGTALVVGGIALAAMIGLTRVYLGVHYLSDVIGGWALGASVFSLCAVVALLATHLRHNHGRAPGDSHQAP
jgi:undecaprenyl-diphosphatase